MPVLSGGWQGCAGVKEIGESAQLRPADCSSCKYPAEHTSSCRSRDLPELGRDQHLTAQLVGCMYSFVGDSGAVDMLVNPRLSTRQSISCAAIGT